MIRRAAVSVGTAHFLDQKSERRPMVISVIMCSIVILIGALDLLGWLFNLTLLRSISAHFVSMSPNSAVCLILSALAICLLTSRPRSLTQARSAKALSLFIIAVGGLVLLQYFTRLDLRVNTLLFEHFVGAAAGHDAIRMEPITAINFILLGAALLAFDTERSILKPLSHLLAFSISLIAALPLIGYLYRSKFMIGIGALSAMAPQTAVCFLILSSVVFIARLDPELAAMLISEGPGGSMSRRILPSAIFILLLLGGVRVWGEAVGLLSYEFGTALFTVANIAGITALIWFQSIAIQKAEERRRAIQHDRDLLDIENRLRDQFISILSHDLRTPVTVASAYAQLIKKFPEKREQSKSYAEKIIDSMTRIDQMTRDLLDVNRIRAGHALQLKCSECDLKAAIKATLSALNVVHENRFVLEFHGNDHCHCDGLAIQRVIENLCNNAAKYGLPRSIITVRVQQSEEGVFLSVHNQGEPIPKEAQVELFSPFQRINTQVTQKTQGWGIGLAVVQGIAEAHGGSVSVQSSKEFGTTFTVHLPYRAIQRGLVSKKNGHRGISSPFQFSRL